jgi:hypothetical protein
MLGGVGMTGKPAVAEGNSTRGEVSVSEALALLRSALKIIDRCGLPPDCGALLQDVIERVELQTGRV